MMHSTKNVKEVMVNLKYKKLVQMSHLYCLLYTLFLVSFSSVLVAAELTILHTNDWQSRYLGFGPNSNFTPLTLNDDQTIGGVSRLASLINQRRDEIGKDKTLLLDAGDYSMGTLFHTIIRETGSELQLLSALQYDAITFGNHDFDFRPDGLAQSINSAINSGAKLPAIVISNMNFSQDDAADDALEQLWEKKIIQPYVVLNRGEKRIGIIGLLGLDAIDVAPNAKPLTFSDPIETANKMVAMLRDKEKVDIIIALSHGGILTDSDAPSGWMGGDLDLLLNTAGIDIVVGGHTHTPLLRPILLKGAENTDRIIVQAGSESQYLGELTVDTLKNSVKLAKYQLHAIDDSILGDIQIQEMIDNFKERVSQEFLSTTTFKFEQLLAETSKPLGRNYNEHILANLVTDSMLKATKADIALNTNGSIRADIQKGFSGKQWVSDLFRVVPLGVGVNNNKLGYDLMKVWVTGKDIKSFIEVMLQAYQVLGQSYYPRIAGFQVIYNPLRVPFDQITDIKIGDDEQGYSSIDLSSSNKKLYSLAANSFVGSFAWLIKDFSYGLLSVDYKDEQGNVIKDLSKAVYDNKPELPGVQEVKEWRAFLEHVVDLPDITGNQLADLPGSAKSRIIPNRSFNPVKIYQNATWIMMVATLIAIFISVILFQLIRKIYQKARIKKSTDKLTGLEP